jgi:hypothetical protein
MLLIRLLVIKTQAQEEFICLLAFQYKFKMIGYFKAPKLYNPEKDN